MEVSRVIVNIKTVENNRIVTQYTGNLTTESQTFFINVWLSVVRTIFYLQLYPVHHIGGSSFIYSVVVFRLFLYL